MKKVKLTADYAAPAVTIRAGETLHLADEVADKLIAAKKAEEVAKPAVAKK